MREVVKSFSSKSHAFEVTYYKNVIGVISIRSEGDTTIPILRWGWYADDVGGPHPGVTGPNITYVRCIMSGNGLLTIKEASARFGIPVKRLRRHIRFHRFGRPIRDDQGHYLVDPEKVKKYQELVTKVAQLREEMEQD